MKYSHDIPTEPGWYWFKQGPKAKSNIKEIFADHGVLFTMVNGISPSPIESLHFVGISMWCKIPEPELP